MLISFARFLYLMSMVIWVGSIIFFSFFGAPSIFKVLDRETAGNVVGDIFPKYWMIGYICGPVALGSLLYSARAGAAGVGIRIALLAAMIVGVYFTGIVVGGKAKLIKAEMRATENVDLKEVVRKRFMKIHGMSMALNLVILILGVVTIFITAYVVNKI